MKIRTADQKGFTLVEIMIVVAIIGLLAAIAIPNFVKARNQSQKNAIINNLRILDGAKDQYALEQKRGSGDTCGWNDLTNYLKGGTVRDVVRETYNINNIGDAATAQLPATVNLGDGAGYTYTNL